jgi:hypothetical protein
MAMVFLQTLLLLETQQFSYGVLPPLHCDEVGGKVLCAGTV